jgi:hypothetical protein
MCGIVISPSEAPTLNMELRGQYGAPTQGFDPAPTYPQWSNPATVPPAAPGTQPIEKKRRKRLLAITLVMITFFIIALIGLGVGLNFLASKDRSSEFRPSAPGSSILAGDELIYPGATVNMRSQTEDEHVLQLKTTNSVDDVVDWYVEKIKPTEHVSLPGLGVTLNSEKIHVVITRIRSTTQIIITQEK